MNKLKYPSSHVFKNTVVKMQTDKTVPVSCLYLGTENLKFLLPNARRRLERSWSPRPQNCCLWVMSSRS